MVLWVYEKSRCVCSCFCSASHPPIPQQKAPQQKGIQLGILRKTKRAEGTKHTIKNHGFPLVTQSISIPTPTKACKSKHNVWKSKIERQKKKPPKRKLQQQNQTATPTANSNTNGSNSKTITKPITLERLLDAWVSLLFLGVSWSSVPFLFAFRKHQDLQTKSSRSEPSCHGMEPLRELERQAARQPETAGYRSPYKDHKA